jgi:hypothetical protein
VSVTVIAPAGPENHAELRRRVPVTPDAAGGAGIQMSWKCDGKDPMVTGLAGYGPAEGRLVVWGTLQLT